MMNYPAILSGRETSTMGNGPSAEPTLEEMIASDRVTTTPNTDGPYYQYNVYGRSRQSVVPAVVFDAKKTELANGDRSADEVEELLSLWASTYVQEGPLPVPEPKDTDFLRSYDVTNKRVVCIQVNFKIQADYDAFKANPQEYTKVGGGDVRKVTLEEIATLANRQELSTVHNSKLKLANVYGFGYSGTITSKMLRNALTQITNAPSEEVRSKFVRSLCEQSSEYYPTMNFQLRNWTEVDDEPTRPENTMEARLMQMMNAGGGGGRGMMNMATIMQAMGGGGNQRGDDDVLPTVEPDNDADGNPITYEHPRCLGCGKHHAPH